MNTSPAVQSTRAFTYHAIGAALLAALILWIAVGALLSPVDIFIHHTYLLYGNTSRFAVSGLVFYGFSLILLRVCPLPPKWAAAYAVSSWVLFILAFFPNAAPGLSGMMRRVADSPGYEASRQSFTFSLHLQAFSTSAVIGFGLVQAAFLWSVLRRLHSAETTVVDRDAASR